MAKVERFEDLEIWQEAREIVQVVYDISGKGESRKDYALRDQMWRAAVSMMANIAEGFSRRTCREFVQFLFLAKASGAEVTEPPVSGILPADYALWPAPADCRCTANLVQTTFFLNYPPRHLPRPSASLRVAKAPRPICVAVDQGYITHEQFEKLYDQVDG